MGVSEAKTLYAAGFLSPALKFDQEWRVVPCKRRKTYPAFVLLNTKGQTPLLRYSFNWIHLPVIAALNEKKFYFRFVQGAIQKKQIVEFLRSLLKQIGRKLLIIWDGLPGHRSKIVTDYLASTNGQIVMEYLPGYAPELNPSEYIWAYAK